MSPSPETSNLISTEDLVGAKVWMERPKKKDPDATKKMGRVRACVFHPSDRRCVGFIVKRPDLALMFRRKDLFVAYNGFERVGDALLIRDDPAATDKGACNAMGIEFSECVLWVGLPVMDESGATLGLVGSVSFDRGTGAVAYLDVSQGSTANALLGMRRVPASLIRGFRFGVGAELRFDGYEEEGAVRGAILVADEARDLPVVGGVAEKAGVATAVAMDKAHRAVDSVKPKVSEAAAAAGEAVNKGAYATGRQLKRASGMFSEFKREYDRASSDDEPEALALEQADDQAEYQFFDEDGNEIFYYDEDGNRITDPALIDEDFEEEIVLEATAAPAKAQGGDTVSTVAKAAGAHLKAAGGMFSAFKEEYDKARR